LDSDVFGAAIENEDDYDPQSSEYWEIVSSKAILKMTDKLSIYGCPPIEHELRQAPEPFRSQLLTIYSSIKSIKTNSLVIRLSREYAESGIYAPDAFILAHSAAHGIHAVITLNKRHLKNPSTLKKIKTINQKHRLPALLLLFPSEFLELFRKRNLL
jgi:predicted nucleic acid-binding protein